MNTVLTEWKILFTPNKRIDALHSIDVPLFTSDGAWLEVLDAGTLIDEDIFCDW